MSYTGTAIKTIYNEREEFIVLGLTGRTGSGCTTVSKILETGNFSDLHLPLPLSHDFKKNEERKYEIIYNYAEKHWHSFYRISMTDIILSFLLTYKFKDLIKVLKDVFKEDLLLYKQIFKECKSTAGFIHNFNDIQSIYLSCFDCENKRLIRDKSKYENEYCLLEKIKKLQSDVRYIFNKFTYTYKIKDLNGKDVVDKKTRKVKTHTANAFTYFLQTIGSNIRKSGQCDSCDFTGSDMFAVARRANDFIKAIRYHNDNLDKPIPTFICLDAIRNPYEATYFQDRYSSFYLLVVNTDDDERIRRLTNENYSKTQISSLDNIEYKSLKGTEKFSKQDIGACCQLGDIYLYNPKECTQEKIFIKILLVRYITLIMHPGLITPTSIERCMQIAYNAKLNSGCLSRQVGAVITDKNYSIKAVGWNSTAEGQVPCNLRNITNLCNNKDYSSFSNYELTDVDFTEHMSEVYNYCISKNQELDGRLYSYCFKDKYEEITNEKNQVHTRSLHAEENAFLQIAKYGGEGIQGGYLFTTASSCVLCSKKAFQLGIKKIYYIDPYPDIALSHIIDFGTDEDRKPINILFYGAIGRAYTNLFTQRIAIKDELENIVCLKKESKDKIQ